MRLAFLLLLCVPAVRAQTAPRFTLDSPTPADGGGFGVTVAAVGDLDGDGTPDVVIGAPSEDATLAGGAVVAGAGQLHAFSGTTGAFLRTYVSPNPQTGAYLGDALLAAGDQDADGTDDFYVSASREETTDGGNQGRIYLLSGASGAEIRSFTSSTQAIDAEFGFDLARLGDLTGDGVGEIGISARLERVSGLSNAGVLYVYDGASEALVYRLTAPSPQDGGLFGYISSNAGDVDGDGTPDIVTGEPGRDASGLQQVGRVYLFSGATGALLRAVRSPNETQIGSFGRWVAGLGDVTGDGVPDVAAGANGEQPSGLQYGGRAYVLSGADGSAFQTILSPDLQLYGFFGELVEAVGDQDGDGRADIAVSARAEDDERIGEGGLIGRVYVFSSATGARLATLKAPTPDPDGIAYFGYGLASLGDLDGDGRAEIGVGAFSDQPPGGNGGGSANFGGRAYVFTGAFLTPAEASAPTEARTLTVGPNPARTAVTVRLGAPAALTVTDALGRVVLRRDASAGETRLDVSGWAPGVYAVTARTEGAVLRTRLTITR